MASPGKSSFEKHEIEFCYSSGFCVWLNEDLDEYYTPM